MPLIRLGIVLGLLLLARVGAAATTCTAAIVGCSASGFVANSTCCTGTTCTIDSDFTTSGPDCTLDFGTRDVTFSGKLTVGTRALTLKAGRFTFNGPIDASSASAKGGSVTVQTVGKASASAVQLAAAAAVVNLSGPGGGGVFHVFADGPVAVLKGGIKADAPGPGAGGDLRIETTAGDVRIDVELSASGVGGSNGGSITLRTPGKVQLPAGGSKLTATGGLGSIDVLAGGAVELGISSDVVADDAGDISIEGASVTAQGRISGTTISSVRLAADVGGITIARTGTSAAIVAEDESQLTLVADAPSPAAQIVIAAPLDLTGNVAGYMSGSLDALATGDIVVQRKIDATGTGSFSDTIALESTQGSVTLQDQGRLLANDASFAGEIDLTAANDVVVRTNLEVQSQNNNSGTGGGYAGAIVIDAGRDARLEAASGDIQLSAAGSGTDTGSHGDVSVSAGRDVMVAQTTTILLYRGTTTGGGTVSLTAGDGGTTGTVTIAGKVMVKAGPGTPAGAVTADACQVNVPAGGLVDVRGQGGQVAGQVQLVARSSLVVLGQVLADAIGTNRLSATFMPPVLPGVSPPFAACDCGDGTSALSCCVRPTCDSPGVPAGCLMPCPACNDGSLTPPETCDAPGCGAGPTSCSATCRLESCDDHDPCTVDSCDAVLGCLNVPKNAGDPCDDGDACILDETCNAEGQCVGTPKQCDDGNVCDGAETCDPSSGACVSGVALACGDGNPCTDDACDPVVGCTHANNAASCDDGDACTLGDTCSGGFCQAGTPKDCPTGQVCVAGACSEQLCGSAADCPDDGDACNGVTHCDAALGCVTTPAVACEDDTVCNGVATCNPATGACIAGTPLDCDDADPCTVDSCDAVTGCHNEAIAGCEPCASAATCDDGDPCTADACTDGVCAHAAIDGCCTLDAQCDDGDVCSGTEHCDLQSHQCQDGTPIGDGPAAGCGDACHPAAACTGGHCVVGDGVTCDDGQLCTVDACDPDVGCIATAVPGCCAATADCNDHDPCTSDACNLDSNTCTHEPVSDVCMPCAADTDCSPLGRCSGQACEGGICTVTTTSCDDGDACTADSCPDAGGCRHDLIAGCCHTAAECDDGDACTTDTCDRTCRHQAFTGYAAVDCRLDGVGAALRADGIGAKTRKRLGRQLDLVRKTRQRAQRAAGSKHTKLGRLAYRQLVVMEKLVEKARGKSVPASAADAIVSAIHGAGSALQQVP